jgi:hypothetical protein
MSALSFSFRPEFIPAYAQTEFLTRFFQLVMDYQTLIAPVPEAPPAESLPKPSAFAPMDGDESVPPVEEQPKKQRKNPWAGLSEEQRAERLAAMKRGRELKKAERRLSADSLEQAAPAPAPAPVPEPPAPAAVEDAASETSSQKKVRKNPWADLTPEQKAERVAKMQAARLAKIAAKTAAAAEDSA